MDLSLSKLQELVMDLEAWCVAVRVGYDWATELNWTELMCDIYVVPASASEHPCIPTFPSDDMNDIWAREGRIMCVCVSMCL